MVGGCSNWGWKLKNEGGAPGRGGKAGSRLRKRTIHDKEEEAPKEKRVGGKKAEENHDKREQEV